ncbi:hypothetical protein SK128_024148 [Halocaridina rubra]|uniref:C2H2-type domain-containing protein n=1 Tax=Halocaridina rubra TaxID=373956 RepID=A0AAN9AA93_HALRR
MNNQDSEGVQEYHHVLAGVECHDGSAMVAGLAMVDDGSVGADITTDIMVTDVAAEVITSEEVLSSKTLVISTDGKLSTAKEADSDGDNLQVNEEAKALEEHIAFIQHHHMEQQQHQNSQQLRLQQIVSAQPQSRAPQSPQQILVTTSSNNHHAQSQGIPIRPNISDIVSSPTTYSNLTSNLNGTLSSSNLPFNILTNTSTVTTTVEQPNNGPCMCFVCGRQLSDPSEKFYYLKTQKLFNTQITLLELLSDVLNQTVITNTGAVDLCARCSELINETDSAYTHLNRLKKQISNLFTSNQRPKLTFQVLPKTSNLGTIGVSSVPLVHQPPKLNLDDLAATRPRRGRQPRNIEAMKKKKKEAELITNKDCVQVKKKGGRPRKPYACHICKRKFHTKDMVASHMIKEHDIHPAGLVRPILRETDSPEPMSDSKEEVKSIPNGNKDPHHVKQEYEDSKEKLILKQCAMQNGIFANQTNPSLSLSTSGVCHTIVSSLSPASSKVGLDATSQVLASLRPIQPKPQTMIQTAPDGSMVLLMHPTVIDSSPTVIKVTPGYMNLKPGPYACDKCKKTFLDEKSRRMHRIAAHGYRKRKRDEEEDEDLVDKSEGHDNLWDCRLCQLSFSSRKTLTDHWKSVHPRCGENVVMNEGKQRVYACEECDMIFHYKYELERHRESHVPYTQMGPHEFVCCVCGLKVASKAALKIHLHRFHSKDEETKDYLCSECGYMASTKKAFTDHQRIHSDEPGPKARCAICEKEMLASSYKIHMLRMHGEAKHPCETCGQRFTVRSDLMRHLNTAHSTLKPYDCDLCGEKFVTSDALRYHRNKVHSTVTHYCEFCDKRYKWKGELRTHVQRNHVEHKERFQCSLCSRNYADRRKLRLHMTTKHNVPKEYCTM